MSDDSATTATRRLDPLRLQRHVGKIGLALGALLAWLGLRGIQFSRIAADDDSTPSIAAGCRVLVRTLEQDDGELLRDALYLFDVRGNAETYGDLRMARLHGLPGDRIEPLEADGRPLARVRIGPREHRLPAEIARLLPERVPDGCVLLLTDNPACRHLDSRALGPVPIERLRLRVVMALWLLGG